MLLLICSSVLFVLLVHYLWTSPYKYWKERGVPNPRPTILVGNIGATVLQKRTIGDVCQEIYNNFKDCLYVGIYKIRKPAILLRDPELIKEVLVKNFGSFHDNEDVVDENIDPIVARNPFFLKGRKWKIVRGQVSSNITTGKIKNMFYLMTNVGKNLIEYLKKSPDARGREGLEAKELAAKFTTDVVAACAFGLDGKSFIEPDAEFRRMGRKFLSPGNWTAFKHTLLFFFPSLSNILKIKFVPYDVEEWFKNTLMEEIKYRQDNKITRNDYLDVMISLKNKTDEYKFEDIDVIAQCMTFYADGFETSSIALSFALFEIAANPEIQRKVMKEVDTVLDKYDGEITYDSIQEMCYLDNVLSEALRKYPPGTVLRKCCTKSFRFPPAKANGSGPHLDVPEGMSVLIPILALHYDPKYFPEPDKFDPDRFTDEAKESRPKYCYLPFGDGPRQCLGFRFAVAQTKAALVSVISNFEITVNPNTRTPIQLDPSYFLPAAKGGLWLNFRRRAEG